MQCSLFVFLVLSSVAVFTSATDVKKCPGASGRAHNPDLVEVSNCAKGQCKLKKGRDTEVRMLFTPAEDIEALTTNVQAQVLGIPLPFIGVDGSSACGNIYNKDDTAKVDCPLKAGTQYLYKRSFPIMEIYPKLTLVVHWALATNKGNEITCFELPSRII